MPGQGTNSKGTKQASRWSVLGFPRKGKKNSSTSKAPLVDNFDYAHIPAISSTRLSSNRELDREIAFLDDPSVEKCWRLTRSGVLRSGVLESGKDVVLSSGVRVSANKLKGAIGHPIDCFVIWSTVDAGNGIQSGSDRQVSYVRYFAHWEEGILLALVRRDVTHERNKGDFIHLLPSTGFHASIVSPFLVYKSLIDISPDI